MNYEEKARWGWTNLTKLGRGYEKTKTLRKGTATAQGCERCKIEAHGDAGDELPGNEIPDGGERYNRETRAIQHGVKNDDESPVTSQSVGFTPQCPSWELKKKKFIATNIHFTTLFQAASAYYGRCIFFYNFPSLKVQLMFFDTHPLYIFIIYI